MTFKEYKSTLTRLLEELADTVETYGEGDLFASVDYSTKSGGSISSYVFQDGEIKEEVIREYKTRRWIMTHDLEETIKDCRKELLHQASKLREYLNNETEIDLQKIYEIADRMRMTQSDLDETEEMLEEVEKTL